MEINKRCIRKREEDVFYIEIDGAMLCVRDKEHTDLEDDEIKTETSGKHQTG